MLANLRNSKPLVRSIFQSAYQGYEQLGIHLSMDSYSAMLLLLAAWPSPMNFVTSIVALR
jgi:hypothetical protein